MRAAKAGCVSERAVDENTCRATRRRGCHQIGLAPG